MNDDSTMFSLTIKAVDAYTLGTAIAALKAGGVPAELVQVEQESGVFAAAIEAVRQGFRYSYGEPVGKRKILGSAYECAYCWRTMAEVSFDAIQTAFIHMLSRGQIVEGERGYTLRDPSGVHNATPEEKTGYTVINFTGERAGLTKEQVEEAVNNILKPLSTVVVAA